MDIYNISSLKIKSVIQMPSEAKVNERIYYGRTLPFYELIYCISGEARVMFHNTELYDKPGQIRFLPKGIENSEYYVDILADGECFDIFFDTDDTMPQNAISEDFSKNTNIMILFSKMHKFWIQKNTGYYNKCMSLFYSILAEMELTSRRYAPASHADKLAGAMEYIHIHYRERDFQYEILPQLCGISYTYFKRLFVESFYILPSQYVRNLRIRYACELLVTNRFSISQVAEMCGFDNMYYFSKVFKQEIGIPPSLYKR